MGKRKKTYFNKFSTHQMNTLAFNLIMSGIHVSSK